ncbi:MAG TPA: glycoside hydrolase family 38 C-terminal domain-containing protein [Terracidiphilus sp.]|nr:glycoside hydrolase family 38 C-terminal domain-containing protein [Terracidiphilus sp.]
MGHQRVSRREFLKQSGAAATLLLAGDELATAANISGRKVLHIIGHSHIDAAWLWPWRDGADTALNTFRSALNRMNENSRFCYSHSSAMHYRWVQAADPAMFAEVRQRIQEGRWEVVGGWPVEPDCNIPATEAFVRHCLYGKRYCRRALGVDVTIGFNPDSFGHAAGLPTILQRAGYDSYVFMRPQEREMNLPLLFWWEGPDGSRVLTLRIWKGYDRKASEIPDAVKNEFAPGMDHAAFFLGVGDHGGAVTAEQVREVVAMQSDPTLPELRWSTLRQFFDAVRQSPAFASLPVIHSELQHHSRGCYSADGEDKYQNRRAERALIAAETISLNANLIANHAYPVEQYVKSWWKVLFCQFHDMLAGTSLYADYQDVRDSRGYACETAQTHKVEALETMAKRVDLRSVKESAIFLYNPLPWPRQALLEVHTERDPDHLGEITHLTQPDGTPVPIQFRPSDSMTNWFPRMTARVELPACGYSVFEIAHGDAPQGTAYTGRAVPSEIGFGISSLKAEDGAELLTAPVGLVVLSDTADTWAHDVSQFRQEIGRPALQSAAVVENGPVCRITRHRAAWQDSQIILDMIEYAGLDAIELHFVIDWHEHQQMMKLEFPTAFAAPRVFAKVPGDILERHVNGEEEPYQDWAAVQGTIGGQSYTVAILNNATYSYDCLGGLFRTVVIRSAPFARHQPWPVTYFDTNAWQDQGRQERRFWLVGCRGAALDLALDRRAEELQTPAECVVDSAHEGDAPRQQSLLEIQPSSVWVLAVKRAEDSPDATVVRIQERAGRPVHARLTSKLLKIDQSVALEPWEIKTLLVRTHSGQPSTIHEISLLEI